MRSILAGLETEYGLLVSGHGAADQIDDAMALVRSYPGDCLAVWDYRYESPRSDLRGLKQRQLTFDPVDAKFDEGRARGPDPEVRSDRILPNGARFYNDHGHPEYSTPECLSLKELALHDKAGELAVLAAARALQAKTDLPISIYKNNTDFHGASYGTHESYLVRREIGFDRIYAAVLPMLIARQVLTGAGKVGAESGGKCHYQLSQRADFFTELATIDTLFRRPIFNTRDEPHADPAKWIRVHVICGDANMMASCTARKVGLVKLALKLAEIEDAPVWKLQDPVRTFQGISRDETNQFAVPLLGRSWTTPADILESYFAVAEAKLDLESEMCSLISECRGLLEDLRTRGHQGIARHVDWAAKRVMLESFMEEEGSDWSDPALISYDLEYHNIDPEEGLFHALEQMDQVEPPAPTEELQRRLERHTEPTRALARGLAVSKFAAQIETAAWRSVTFRDGEDLLELELPPDRTYPAQLEEAQDVGTFIEMIGGTA